MIDEKDSNFPHFDSQPPSNVYTQSSTKGPHYQYPTVAGFLLIISSLLAVVYIIFVVTSMSAVIGNSSFYGYSSYPYNVSAVTTGMVQSILMICGIVIIVLSIFSLLGGIMSLKKKMWGFALTGAILGLFTLGPVFISSILSLIALILIAISRDEFQKSNGI